MSIGIALADLTWKRAKARPPQRGIHAASTVVLGNVENFMRVYLLAAGFS